jgi:hypothetical protein
VNPTLNDFVEPIIETAIRSLAVCQTDSLARLKHNEAWCDCVKGTIVPSAKSRAMYRKLYVGSVDHPVNRDAGYYRLREERS